MKPFLILQLRELDEAADNEFDAFLRYGQLAETEVRRIRMEQESFVNLNADDFAGIIVGGGPSNVSDDESEKPTFQKRFEKELSNLFDQIFQKHIPFLGSCYGFGALINYVGGEVSKDRYSEEVGGVMIQLTEDASEDPILQGLPESFTALCGHKEACQFIPKEGVLLGSSESCPFQIIRFEKNIYATQFHCELDAEGIGQRIRYYKHHGYFEPEAATSLINKTKNLNVEIPQLILKRFVELYRS